MKRFDIMFAALCVSAVLVLGCGRSDGKSPPSKRPGDAPASNANADSGSKPADAPADSEAKPADVPNNRAPATEAESDNVGQLLEQLKDASPSVRAQAAYKLGELGDAARPAMESLVALVADTDPHVRAVAAHAVLKIRPGPEVTRPIAKKLLAESDDAARMRFLHALADLGKEVVPGLIDALKDDELAKYACVVLAEIGPEAAEAGPALAERLRSEKRPEVRQRLIMALGAVESAETAPDLIAIVEDTEHDSRIPAAFALGRLGPSAKQAAAALSKGMEDADPVLKVVSAWALMKVSPDDQSSKDKAVGVMVEGLSSDNPLAQKAAMRALADLRPKAPGALPAVKRILEGENRELAAEALDILASLGESAVGQLTETLQKAELRAVAAAVLGHIGPDAKAAVSTLLELLKTEKDPTSRRELFLALSSIAPETKEAVPLAIESLDDPDDRVVLAACLLLGKIGPDAKEALPALKALTDSKDEVIREFATKAVQSIEK